MRYITKRLTIAGIILMFLLLAFTMISSQDLKQLCFPDLWEGFTTEAIADRAVDSSDVSAETLKKAGKFYFLRCIGGNNVKQAPSNERGYYAEKALDTITKAHYKDRRDTEIRTLYGLICLYWAGYNDSISKKIKYTKRGIGSLDIAIQLMPNNLDILFIRVTSIYRYPKKEKYYTPVLINDALRYLDIMDTRYNELPEEALQRLNFQKQDLLIYLATLYLRKGEPENAEKYFNMIDVEMFNEFRRTNTDDYSTKLYNELKDRF